MAAVFLLVGIMYWLAISRTFGLYFYNIQLREQIDLAKNAPEQVKNLERKSTYLQGTINYLQEGEDLRKELLNVIGNSSQHHDVLFKAFQDSHIQDTDDIIIETHEVVLEGSFSDLVRIVHGLEKGLSMGKTVSLKLELEIDRRTKIESLVARIYVQSIQKQISEN